MLLCLTLTCCVQEMDDDILAQVVRRPKVQEVLKRYNGGLKAHMDDIFAGADTIKEHSLYLMSFSKCLSKTTTDYVSTNANSSKSCSST